jgi:hypothetical protein
MIARLPTKVLVERQPTIRRSTGLSFPSDIFSAFVRTAAAVVGENGKPLAGSSSLMNERYYDRLHLMWTAYSSFIGVCSMLD